MTAVVQVITALERGGAQRLALEIAAGLHRRDRPQLLLCGTGSDALLDEARARLGDRLLLEPTLIGPLRLGTDLAALSRIARTLARLKRQHGRLVVSTHSSKAGIVGRLAARSVPGLRTVHTVHGFGVDALGPRHRPLLIAVEQLASAATDVLLLLTEADRRRCEELRLSRRPERRLLPASIDGARWSSIDTSPGARAEARSRLGIAGDVPLAVTVGNLKVQKDPLFHVEVLAAWRRRQPDAELLLLGDGPLRADTVAAARAAGIDAALHLPGFVHDPTDALVAADVMLLASRWEGLPLSVLEGLAGGLPVVVRHTGWADDLDFAGERLSALGPDARPASFAEALERAVELPRERCALPRRFTWSGTLEALEQLYGELLA